MNLTYIIGNGFDIGLGLKTSYADFLNEFLSLDSDWARDGKGVERLRKMIVRDRQSWSDAEQAFAKIDFNKLVAVDGWIPSCDKELHEYRAQDTCNFFIRKLGEFLMAQQERVSLSIDDSIRHQFLKALLIAPVIHSQSKRYSFQEWQTQVMQTFGSLDVNFITFNYTSVLERLLGATPFTCYNDEIMKEWGAPVRFNTPIHVHGKLEGREVDPDKMVFGVSYRDQIEHPPLGFDDAWIEKRFVKPDRLDFECKSVDDASSDVSSILAASDVIVLFGVSLGSSDAKWWNSLGELMRKNGRMHLVYCDFNKIAQCPVAGFETEYLELVRNKVLQAMEVGLETRQYIEKRIFALSQGPVYYPDDKERQDPIMGDPLCLKWFGGKLEIQ